MEDRTTELENNAVVKVKQKQNLNIEKERFFQTNWKLRSKNGDTWRPTRELEFQQIKLRWQREEKNEKKNIKDGSLTSAKTSHFF